MLGMTSIQELVILMMLVGVLSMTGLWPMIMRGLRELRGDSVPAHDAPETVDLCYKILGVSSSASWSEVQKAYRRKAKIHHPDLGGDEDAMRALNEAYSRLKAVRRD